MTVGWMTAVICFAFAMAATPGPNNTIVASSGATHGFMASVPYNIGIGIGLAVIMFAVAAFGVSIISHPTVALVLKWVGVTYLLWLAFKIATSKPALASDAAPTAPLTFIQGVLFQFVNPKIWIMVSGAVVTYGAAAKGLGPIGLGILFAALFGVITVACTLGWTGLGAALRRILSTPFKVRIFNSGMATLLLASLVPVVFE